MRDGFLRVAAATPSVRVADPAYNREQIEIIIRSEAARGNKVLVFPELALSAYTCGDLFLQDTLQEAVLRELRQLLHNTADSEVLCFVGLPFAFENRLYNAVAVFQKGELLGLVPKLHIPNYGEFYERRYFTPGFEAPVLVPLFGERLPFGARLLFSCESLPELKIGVEICEDLWVPNAPSIDLCTAGATLIVNCSASNALAGKRKARRELVKAQSSKLLAGYVYASAGEGESTQDLVFSAHNLIAEAGEVLAESPLLTNTVVASELDLKKILFLRRRQSSYPGRDSESNLYCDIDFDLSITETELTRKVNPAPFVPAEPEARAERCEEILRIQSLGLKKRLDHIHGSRAVLGLSGGLDSTLALLVAVRSFDALGLPRSGIETITMPAFGTTDRTYRNACELAAALGTSLEEISIREAVLQHFKDIKQDPEKHDITYENAQARERTQVLMDIANRDNALVIGTGDLSELALGWATYNGDHMSMYAVNVSVPKTLVRVLVEHEAGLASGKLREVLLDILDTPVSPELLPPKDGVISQKTEDLVGPYELHDFFLFQMLRFGSSPRKIYRLACRAFAGVYDGATVKKWLLTFLRRFFTQQFKRSCLPDGPKTGSVAVSPRGDLRMPSDAVSRIWLEEAEAL